VVALLPPPPPQAPPPPPPPPQARANLSDDPGDLSDDSASAMAKLKDEQVLLLAQLKALGLVSASLNSNWRPACATEFSNKKLRIRLGVQAECWRECEEVMYVKSFVIVLL
jgi:hypothetical protein